MVASRVYFSIGSNIGDRAGYLCRACSFLKEIVDHLHESSVYETAPWGFTEQPAFLNMAVGGDTALSPLDLLKAIKKIESRLGRKPTFRNGPREIDIDILLYDNQEFTHADLTIPHPRLKDRAFVLIPLAEIAPLVTLPGTSITIRAMAEECERVGIHRVEVTHDHPSSN